MNIHNTSHGSKLLALLDNKKLPMSDKSKVCAAIEFYKQWLHDLSSLKSEYLLIDMVKKLNEYKNYIDIELIFKSENDFLYRQNGQLKLSNSILEEFLPFLFDPRLIPGLKNFKNLRSGSISSFSGLSFGPVYLPTSQKVSLKVKDQDFSVAQKHRIQICSVDENDKSATNNLFSSDFYISYFAAEIKTNLDKTMFQEASQTAAELKTSIPSSKYILACEFLDMTPISTKLTAIDEVIILRKTKRIPSYKRSDFSTYSGRQSALNLYQDFIEQNPLSVDGFERILIHLRQVFPEQNNESIDAILNRGYF